MTTIINTPPVGERESADSGLGLILGIILTLILFVLFFVYGLPAIRTSRAEPEVNDVNINVQLPSESMDAVSVGNP